MNDRNRIIRCMQRARRGEELTIGFFGGSITQGSLASDEESCYARRVFRWWEEQFPAASLHYVNAGIGGTSSHYGAARAVEHLLMYQPDFVIVDFSVNDEADEGEFFQETYEGVLRQILAWPSKPGVLILNNVYYDSGINAQEYHNQLAEYYGIPYVSIKDAIYKRMLAGEWRMEELTPDGLHPNDFGHGLVAGELCRYLEKLEKEEAGSSTEADDWIPEPVTANAYEAARRITIANCTPQLRGFHTDTREKLGRLDHFKNGWFAQKTGERIVFRLHASCIAVQYRKTITKPAPVAHAILDGDTAHPVTLDANFEEDWGDCLYLQRILHHGTAGDHILEIEIVDGDERMPAEFYLLSLIVAD